MGILILSSFVLCGGLVAEPVNKVKDATPELRRVLIIGDSISIGYMEFLPAFLKGEAVVEHNPGNAEHSRYGLENLDAWLGTAHWDVIHFNFGLHDLKYVDDAGKNVKTKEEGHLQVPVAQYKKNLNQIVKRLKKTKAKLIFATTTPFPDNVGNPLRSIQDLDKYNEAALKVMKKHHVSIDDLHGFALPRLTVIQKPKNVHFTSEGSKILAREVAKNILDALPATAP